MDKDRVLLVRGYFNELFATVQSSNMTFAIGAIRRELMVHTQIPLAQIKLAVEYDYLEDSEHLAGLVHRGAQIRF